MSRQVDSTNITGPESEPDSDRTLVDRLREANEKLVAAVMRAEQAAQTTAQDLAVLSQSSQRDVLTGSFNRESIVEHLDAAIRMAGRSRTRLATLFIDLDRFKAINDRRGHAVGDRALQIVTRRLQLAVRRTDSVGRYGGDEFIVVLSPIARPADAANIAAKITAALAAPILVDSGPLSMSASVGIALYPKDGVDAKALVDIADSAMYEAKRVGPGRFAFHSDTGAAAAGAAGSASPEVSDSAAAAAPATSPHRDLIDANERLVIAAIASQEASSHAEEARIRHIRFMAMVAHELRDPLAPLRTGAELLSRIESDDWMLVKSRDIITRQVERLSRLVDDLLDGSRRSAGQFLLRIAPMDLVALLNLAIDACRQQMSTQQQTLTFDAPDIIPVDGDSVRLMQIFINLLENASKYTPPGGEIRVSATIDGQSIMISIADNGIGIPAGTLPNVFDLYVQQPGDRARRNGGLGIGLAVVRDLVVAHGGTVIARSAGIDRGSEFVVTLPLGDLGNGMGRSS